MTRPTWPADPSPDEAQPDSQQADSAPPRPTFTPRHQGPDSQDPYPSGPVPPPTAPFDGGRSRPSFTPRSTAPPTSHTVPPGRDDRRGGDQRRDDQRAD